MAPSKPRKPRTRSFGPIWAVQILALSACGGLQYPKQAPAVSTCTKQSQTHPLQAQKGGTNQSNAALAQQYLDERNLKKAEKHYLAHLADHAADTKHSELEKGILALRKQQHKTTYRVRPPRAEDWSEFHEYEILLRLQVCTESGRELRALAIERYFMLKKIIELGFQVLPKIPLPTTSSRANNESAEKLKQCDYVREMLIPPVIALLKPLVAKHSIIACIANHYTAVVEGLDMEYPIPRRTPETESIYSELAEKRIKRKGIPNTIDNTGLELEDLEMEYQDYDIAISEILESDPNQWKNAATWLRKTKVPIRNSKSVLQTWNNAIVTCQAHLPTNRNN